MEVEIEGAVPEGVTRSWGTLLGKRMARHNHFKRIAIWNFLLRSKFLAQGRSRRSLQLSDHLAQVNLPLEQPPPPGLADAPEVAKEENCCSVRGEPQCGHLVTSGFFPRTNFSKTFPHLWQAYSKIGIGLRHPFFCLSGAQLGPDPGRGFVAHVNRETPGIRGSTTNQTTMKRRKIRKLSIFYIISLPPTHLKSKPLRHVLPEPAGF